MSSITAAEVSSQPWTDAFASKSEERFGAALADDVVLEGTALMRTFEGRDQVMRVMGTASGIYESVQFTHEASNGPRTYLEWEATALGGLELRGVTVLTKDDGGLVTHAAIHHRPLGAALRFSEELGKRLTGVVESDYFYTPAASPLSYEVFVSDGVQRASGQLPNGDPIVSSPVSSTLIFGEHDAVLADVPFTHEQIEKIGDWIKQSGKRLAYIYITHGHGDHWLGTAELLKRFPGATVYATEGTIEVMRQQAGGGREQLWDKQFPGLIPESPILADPVPAEGFLLEGNVIQAVEVGHTDTDNSTVLHVPSIGLVVAGDAVYNGVHQYFLEGGDGGLQEWLTAIDRVEALRPRAVVAGHKNRDLPDDPAILDQTRQYLRDVIRLLDEKPTAREFFDQMLELYPDRLNPGPVWYGALGLLGE